MDGSCSKEKNNESVTEDAYYSPDVMRIMEEQRRLFEECKTIEEVAAGLDAATEMIHEQCSELLGSLDCICLHATLLGFADSRIRLSSF